MHWFDWVLVAWLFIGVLSCAYIIDKPREKFTSANFAAALITNTLLITGIFLTRL